MRATYREWERDPASQTSVVQYFRNHSSDKERRLALGALNADARRFILSLLMDDDVAMNKRSIPTNRITSRILEKLQPFLLDTDSDPDQLTHELLLLLHPLLQLALILRI